MLLLYFPPLTLCFPWGSCECFVVENFLRNICCWGGIVSCRRFDFCFLRFCCRRFKFFQTQNVPKVVAFFLLESFLPQDSKTLHFFEEISSPQKKVVIFAYSGGSDKEMIHRLYSKLFTVNLLGTKSFSLVTNFLIFSVHRGLIQNNKFQRFPPQPPSS